MIVTTTANVDGKKIIEYKGIVFGEVVSGVNVLKDFTAGMRNFFGGRSASYEDELMHGELFSIAVSTVMIFVVLAG